MRTFTSFDDLTAAVGEDLGASDWLTIEQDRVDAFAEATGDHQWIHVDVPRATAGPFGGTIAHGYLTLSLIPMLGAQVFGLETPGAKLNYGVNKVRFPVPAPGRLPHPRARQGRRRRRRPRRQAGHLRLGDRDRGRHQTRLRRRDRRPPAALSRYLGLFPALVDPS